VRFLYENVKQRSPIRQDFSGGPSGFEEVLWQRFAALDQLEERLRNRRSSLWHRIVESDGGLFCTLIRFVMSSITAISMQSAANC